MTKKMRMTLIGIIGILFIIVISSCTAFQIDGLEVHKTPTQGTVIGDFSTTVSISKFCGVAGGVNLFNITSKATDPKIIQAIQAEINNRDGTSAVGVKIVYKATFVNYLLNVITATIYAPSTAIVTGTIIR
jgi:hypothetical protein